MTRNNRKSAPSKKIQIAERTAKILSLREQGKTQVETARELGIKRSMVMDTERKKFNIWGE